ncbi:MAG: MgtC/SapB family protein [Proteobacteria bacterium]|nr:MgtC/SapB family protein [Pseudomonadota bacterium]
MLDLLQRLALALALGLLIGIERGWQEREGKDGSRAAGVRTYALTGLLGGIAAALQGEAGGAFLDVAFATFAAALALFEWRESVVSGSVSATGLIAGLLTFALGAYAVLGSMAVAAAAAIVATFVLAERRLLHQFVLRLTWEELRAALLLLAMTFVLLPILPDHPVDPWNALNPRQLWIVMVIIAAVSYVGYICVRLTGERTGLVLGAAAGGLVSSTAVTLAYARLSKIRPQAAAPLTSGITVAWAVSILRMSAIAVGLSPALLVPLSTLFAPAIAVLVVLSTLFYRRAAAANGEPVLALKDPFELDEVFKFGLLLAAVTLIAKLAGTGNSGLGLVPLAAISGLVDVDPITLSAARMVGDTITPRLAADVIAVAALANVVCKTGVGAIFGSRRLFLNLLGAAVLASLASGTVAAWGWS